MNVAAKQMWIKVLFALAMLGGSVAAPADVLLVDRNVMVNVTSAPLSETLGLTSAGMLTVTIADLAFPQLLDSLSFAISNSNQELLRQVGAGSLHYVVSGPMTLFANVYAVPNALAGSGLYHINVSFAPAVVPLPSAALLFLSGFAGMTRFTRATKLKRKSVTVSMVH
jgi:hypothetical protein